MELSTDDVKIEEMHVQNSYKICRDKKIYPKNDTIDYALKYSEHFLLAPIINE